MEEFNYLFESKPFYNASYEDHLPDIEATKLHFIELYEEYKNVGTIVDKTYGDSMVNMDIFLGAKGEYITINKEEYYQYHAYYHRLKLYYDHLLNACRRKHDIWLNDFIPDKYKVIAKPKKSRKESVITLDTETIIVNTKPSNRAIDNFKALCPEARFIGRKWKSKVTQYSVPVNIWEERKDRLKQYANKSNK